VAERAVARDANLFAAQPASRADKLFFCGRIDAPVMGRRGGGGCERVRTRATALIRALRIDPLGVKRRNGRVCGVFSRSLSSACFHFVTSIRTSRGRAVRGRETELARCAKRNVQ